jgi:glutathione synthase/RimK-type ligase-like ATP-grasp enzyme
MVQSYVHAEKDVTVAFVRDQMFAFELDRTSFREQTADWREMPTDWEAAVWRPHELPDSVTRGISGFMADLGLHFGRLDFLLGPEGYFFLEVNTNGEWAWLDTDGRHGLLLKVAREIDPDTDRYPIPACGPGHGV